VFVCSTLLFPVLVDLALVTRADHGAEEGAEEATGSRSFPRSGSGTACTAADCPNTRRDESAAGAGCAAHGNATSDSAAHRADRCPLCDAASTIE
jgi:hypothetical protein